LTISGGKLSIASASTTSSTLTLTGGTLGGAGNLSVSGLTTLNGNGTLSGSGTVTANGGMALSNNLTFTIDGKTVINPAGQTAAWTASPGLIILKSGAQIMNDGTFNMQVVAASGVSSSGNQGASVAFTNNGAFVCHNSSLQTFEFQSVPLNVTSGATVEVQSGALLIGQVGGGGTSTGGAFTSDFGGNLDFAGSTYTLDAASTINGAGTVSVTGGTETIQGTYQVTGRTLVQGAMVIMSGNNPAFTGPTNLSGGTLLVKGLQPNRAVSVTGGTLGGLGTVAPITSTATISPGTPSATGILSAQGNFTMSTPAAFKGALQGANPGTGFDQLAVAGTASIMGSTLNPSLSGFTPASGETFPIITSAAPIVGTFNNLNEGASLTIGGMPFTISYLNNDVTLTGAAVAAPTATTDPATISSGTAATLKGSANPEGAATTVKFVYGTDSNLATNTTTTAAQSIGSGTSDVSVTADLTGLAPGTQYFAQLVAMNNGITTDGSIVSFTTPTPPAGATTGVAKDVTGTSATPGGNVNPAGSASSVMFLYGTDPTLTTGTSTTPVQSVGSGSTVIVVNIPLTSLLPGTKYYYQFEATNAGGTTRGLILSFTTSAVSATSSVTVTSFGVEKVALGTGRHKKRYLVFGVGYWAGLDPTAAQNLAAYAVYSGKVKKVHKVSQVTYTGHVPLTQAIYFPAQNLVALVPKGRHELPKFEQLHVNVSIVTDPMGNPINNGTNLTATVTNRGQVISAERVSRSAAPAEAAVDALFERQTSFPVRAVRHRP
jgi:hypothetical protein